VNLYPFIEAEKAGRRSVKRACELLKVSRAAFYQHLAGPSQHAQDDTALTAEIQVVHAQSKGRYGAPRVHAELRHLALVTALMADGVAAAAGRAKPPANASAELSQAQIRRYLTRATLRQRRQHRKDPARDLRSKAHHDYRSDVRPLRSSLAEHDHLDIIAGSSMRAEVRRNRSGQARTAAASARPESANTE
jgi:hypothetical protein